MRVGLDKQLLDYHARIYLDFSHSLQLCHLMAGAVSLWSTGMGGSSRRTRFSTPALSLPHTHPSAFLSISLYLCIYFCWFTLSASSMHTVHTKANLVQYDTYLSCMILFSQHGNFQTIVKVDLFLVLLVGILLVVIAQMYCCHLLLYHLFQNNVFFYCFYCSFLLILPLDQGS